VRPRTLRAFAQRFEPCGFRYSAVAPSYGLAEATLTVTTCRPGAPPREVIVSAASLRRGRIAPPAQPDDELVPTSCGTPLRETRVRILPEVRSGVEDAPNPGLDQAGAVGPVVGEVWISGPQVVEGGAADELEGQPGRRTGDIGFIHAGELVLLGRATERFQYHGANYYCAELEEAVAAACPEVRPGRVAVFATTEADGNGEPEVVVLAELRDGAGAAAQPLELERAERVRLSLRKQHGLPVHRVEWLPPRSLPVTTSGKLRRLACRELYQRGSFVAPREV
jgi:acyl-CoA synthetase (AMP-forming)/AMP-acid ligase II